MQTIRLNLRADSVAAEIVDDYNQPSSASLPYLTRGMSVDIALGLYASAESDQRMTSAQLGQYSAFDFCLADDWDTSSPVQIRVNEGIRVDDDGLIHIVIGNTTTAELLEQLGSAESIVLGAELDAYAAGEDVPTMVLQWDMGIRNRRMDDSTETPPEVPGGYYTAAQLKAMLSASLDFQYSRDGMAWHDEQTPADEYFRSRSTATAEAEWSEAMAVPRGADGRTVNPDGIGPIAERPAAPAEGFCWMSSDEGKAYWFQDGAWTEGVPLTTVPGPQGDQGIQGEQGEQGIQGEPFRYSDFTPDQLAALKGNPGDKGDPGIQGVKGDPGDGLHIDATDSFSRRHIHDQAAAGFTFLATDIYCDTITSDEGGVYEHSDTGDVLDKDGKVTAYAWSNPTLATVYTRDSYPGIGAYAFPEPDLTGMPVMVVDKGASYNVFYQKNSDRAGDWSAAVRTYMGRKGDQGQQGERGEKGNDGDAAFAPPDVVFLDQADPNQPDLPAIDSSNALTIIGTKAIAEVLRRIADADNPGHVAYVRADEGTDYTLRYCLTEDHTILYVLDRSQWSLGGRIRYAQAGALVPRFLHVAYASNDRGDGFSLIPNNHLEYRAEIQTTTQGDPTLEDFRNAGAIWIHYFAADGGGVKVDGTTIVQDPQYDYLQVGEIRQTQVTGLADTLDSKITAPAGGRPGQVLTKTDSGVTWKDCSGGGGGANPQTFVMHADPPTEFDGEYSRIGDGSDGTFRYDSTSGPYAFGYHQESYDLYSLKFWRIDMSGVFLRKDFTHPLTVLTPDDIQGYYTDNNGLGHDVTVDGAGGGGANVTVDGTTIVKDRDNTISVGEIAQSQVTGLPEALTRTVPEGGTRGQVLTKTDTGADWRNASGGGQMIACISKEQPAGLFDGLIWIHDDSQEQPDWVSANGTPAVVIDDPSADPSDLSDFSIILTTEGGK